MSKKPEDVDQSAWDAARKPARFALAGPGFRTEAALRQGEVLVRTAIARAIMAATAAEREACVQECLDEGEWWAKQDGKSEQAYVAALCSRRIRSRALS